MRGNQLGGAVEHSVDALPRSSFKGQHEHVFVVQGSHVISLHLQVLDELEQEALSVLVAARLTRAHALSVVFVA